MADKQQTTGWVLLAGFAALLAYLLKNSSSLLHESVTAGIVTPQNTVKSDPMTGLPQYDSRIPATVPANEEFAQAPLNTATGTGDNHPASAALAVCPIGYQLYKNAADGSLWCIPQAGITNQQLGFNDANPGSLVV